MQKNLTGTFDRFLDEMANDISKTTIGINRQLAQVRNALGTYDSYPPFNFEQLDATHYRATFALAGFTKDELEVTFEDSFLYITGEKVEEPVKEGSTRYYHHRGIANRSFKRMVQLATDIVITGASMENGLLHVDLEQVVPEEKKAKTIKIK